VNEANEFIFANEKQLTTWYGHDYFCSFVIKAGTSFRLKKGTKPDYIPQIMQPVRTGKSYVSVEIPYLQENDIAYVENHRSNACVCCARPVNVTNKAHEVTNVTWADYCRYHESVTKKKIESQDRLKCGLVCNNCYSKYCRFKKKMGL